MSHRNVLPSGSFITLIKLRRIFASIDADAASDRPGIAVVTGASSGIGDEYAARLAAAGYNLALVACRTQRLRRLADLLRGEHGVAVEEVTADLARVARWVAGSDVTLLVNNAGINGYGMFTEVDAELQVRVIALNVTAPTMLSRAALPGMVACGRGARSAGRGSTRGAPRSRAGRRPTPVPGAAESHPGAGERRGEQDDAVGDRDAA